MRALLLGLCGVCFAPGLLGQTRVAMNQIAAPPSGATQITLQQAAVLCQSGQIALRSIQITRAVGLPATYTATGGMPPGWMVDISVSPPVVLMTPPPCVALIYSQ
ncbi:MAG TPA: hypothetical protein VN841_29270 [Bryobacteraceae bacterium]|nr:hypothetical protein [Bryobacteraceae bacterium]